jgi:large subunit ribosomal protein L16
MKNKNGVNRKYLVIPKAYLLEKRVQNTQNVALQATASGMVSAASIEAARKAIRKAVKKTGQVVMRTWAYLPITKKPAEVRMGKGKGKIDSYVSPVPAGKILFEIRNVSISMATKALQRAATKLSVVTRTVILKDRFH